MGGTYADLIASPGIVVTAIDGSASNVPAGASPGDVVEFHNASGQAYFTTVQSDGTIADPVPASKLPAAAVSSSDYPAAADIAPDAPAAMQQHYEAVRNDPNAKPSDINTAMSMLVTAEKAQQSTANTTATRNAAAAKASEQQQALATSAEQKIAAGQKPTASELAAYNLVNANGAVNPPSAKPADWSPVISAINSITSDPRVQQAMAVGAALEGGIGATYGAGDGGMSWGPFQINHNDGMHSTISRADSEDPVKAATYMLPDYQAAVDKVPAALWQSNPMQAAAQAAYLAERPAQMYDPTRVAAAWKQVTGSAAPGTGNPLSGLPPTTKTIGGRDFQWDPGSNSWIPAPGLPATISSADIKNFGDSANPQWFQMDPSSGKWSPVSGPDGSPIAPLSRTMSMLQQFQTTTAYIKQQVANGTLDLNTANQYQQSNWQSYQAGLQGTTPFELQKAQEAIRAQQATEAENLIKDQLTSGQQLTQSILTSVGAMKSFNGWAPGLDPFAYARAENTLNTNQAAGGQNVGSLVRSLLQASGVQVPTGGNVPPMPSSLNITAPTQPLGSVAPPPPPPGGTPPPPPPGGPTPYTPMTPLAPMMNPSASEQPAVPVSGGALLQ